MNVSSIRFKYRLGELTLCTVARKLLVVKNNPFRDLDIADSLDAYRSELPAGADGVLLRSTPVAEDIPRLTLTSKALRYVPSQYERFFVDLTLPYEEYLKSFSRKSRSTLRRKVRKFAELSGGTPRWTCYETIDEFEEFYRLAREISAESYQEQLLGAGFPSDEASKKAMFAAVERGEGRGYLIFLGSDALAYLYCPTAGGVVTYAYLGYRPDASNFSPGTVLLWLVMEDLFQDGRHRLFDFTEGGDRSLHSQKRLFSTGSVQCADVYFLKLRVGNVALALTQTMVDGISEGIGRILTSVGVKKRIRGWTRRVSSMYSSAFSKK